VVADSHGRGSVDFWIALDCRLRIWRWTIHLYSFLNQSKSIFAPKAFCPGSIPNRLVGLVAPNLEALARANLGNPRSVGRITVLAQLL